MLEELAGVLYREVQHVGDGAAPILHLERLGIVTAAVADLAGHFHVGQEVHLNRLYAIAFAGRAHARAIIEAEAPARKTAHPRLGKVGKEVADAVE